MQRGTYCVQSAMVVHVISLYVHVVPHVEIYVTF